MKDQTLKKALHSASPEVTKCWLESDRASAERDHQRTLALLEKARSLAPDHPGVLLRLGHAYAKRYLFSNASECFEKLDDLVEPSADLLLQIADYWKRFGRTESSLMLLKRALEIDPRCPGALLEIAEIEEKRHQLDAAEEAIGKALEIHETSHAARFLHAVILRRKNENERAIELLQKLLREKPESTEIHVRAWHELGRHFDRRKEYTSAFEAFQKGKQLIAPFAKPYRDAFEREKRLQVELQKSLTKSQILQWKRDLKARFQSGLTSRMLFVGGAPRSGTTLVASILAAHSELVVIDECPAFGPEIADPIERLRLKMLSRKNAKGRNRKTKQSGLLSVLNKLEDTQAMALCSNYVQRLSRWNNREVGNRYLVDKNPALTQSMPIMFNIVPGLKAIILRRDPRDIAISCFMQALPLNNISVNFHTLKSTMEYVSFVEQTWDSFKQKLDHEDFLEIQYHKLVNDAINGIKELLDFLELAWEDDVLHFQQTAKQSPMKSPTYEDVTKELYSSSIGRWQNYESLF